MRQVILDTETTGLSTAQGHRVIEIGCVELLNRRLTGREYHCYLNPDRDIEQGAEAVHGITRADLETAPRFPEIAGEFIAFIAGAELVIHNADFDVGFLEHELRLMQHPQPSIDAHATVLDTLALARKLHPGQRNSLDALCKRYAVDASGRHVHGALIDSELLAQVYLAMTGGQTSLGLGDDASGAGDSAAAGNAAGDLSTAIGADLPVVRATAAELEAHEAYLERLRDAPGGTAWDRL